MVTSPNRCATRRQPSCWSRSRGAPGLPGRGCRAETLRREKAGRRARPSRAVLNPSIRETPEDQSPGGTTVRSRMRESIVQARGLTKKFGDFVAVDAIDFDIAKGEAFGFLGPNGAGKTSTMKMITTVSPISEGKLSVF